MVTFKKIKPEFKKLPLKKLFVFSFFASLILLIISVLSQAILPPVIPLFYGLPQTEDQLAPSILMLLPAFISLVLTTINMLVALKIDDVYLKRALAFTSLAVSILAIVTTIKIMFLVSLL